MKSYYLVFYIFIFHSPSAVYGVDQHNLTNAIIRQLFEMLRSIIKYGNVESANIPVVDPFRLDGKIYLADSIYDVKISFRNGSVKGLGDFELIKYDFLADNLLLNLVIKFPSIIIRSEYYNLNGGFVNNFFKVKGRGKFFCEFHNFEFMSEALLKQSEDGKSVFIDKFIDPQFYVNKIVSKSQFDEKYAAKQMNRLIEDLMANYLTKYSHSLCSRYMNGVKNIINTYFSYFESWRVISVIVPNGLFMNFK